MSHFSIPTSFAVHVELTQQLYSFFKSNDINTAGKSNSDSNAC